MLRFLPLVLCLHPPAWAAEPSREFVKVMTLKGSEPAEQFGTKADWAGDVNGDGYDDFIVGAPGAGRGRGKVYLFLGSKDGISATPAWTFSGEAMNDNLGKVVAGLGDVNGDGYDDIYMDAPENGDGARQGGKVYVFYGGPKGPGKKPDWTFTGKTEEEHLGDCAAPGGDINGDGYFDLAVGAYGFDHYRGRVLVFYGGPKGFASKADWVFPGEHTGDWFGYGIGPAGDLNGDGYGDMVFGAKNHAEPEGFGGKVYAFLGSAKGLAAKPAWIFAGHQAKALLGNRIVGVGDVDGDGWPDFATGAPLEADGKGAAYVFFGSAAGIDFSRHLRFEGQRKQQGLGYMVAPAADLDGDGYSDVLLGGMAQFTVPGSFQILYGGPSPHLGQRADETVLGGQLGSCLGLAGSLGSSPLFFVSRHGAGKDASWPGELDIYRAGGAAAGQALHLSYATDAGTKARWRLLRGAIHWKKTKSFRLKASGAELGGMAIYLQEPGGKKIELKSPVDSRGEWNIEGDLKKIKSPWVRILVKIDGVNETWIESSGGRLSVLNTIFVQ